MNSLSSCAERYRSCCEELTGAAADRPPLWECLEHRVSLDDLQDVTLLRTFRLNSDRLITVMAPTEDTEIIPAPLLADESSGRISVSAAAMGRRRDVEPITHGTISATSYRSLLSGNAFLEFLPVPLSHSEYTNFAEVAISTKSQSSVSSPGRGHLANLIARTRPVSGIFVELGDDYIPSKIDLDLPEFASTHIALLEITLNLAGATRLSAVLSKLESPTTSVTAATQTNLLRNECRQTYDIVQQLLDHARKTIESGIGHLQEVSARRRDRAAESLMVTIDAKQHALREWEQLSRSNQSAPLTADDSRAAFNDAKKLLSILERERVKLRLPVRVTEGSAVDLVNLQSYNRVGAASIRQTRLYVPFTTDKEPSTLGKRSSTILGLLAGVILAIALVNFAHIRSMPWIEWLPESAPRRIGNGREMLVGILLIFPAALYAQFFQSRPQSAVGVKTQLTTFAVLSLVFILPIFPAFALALQVPLHAVAILALAVGSLTMIFALVAWRLTAESVVRWLRTDTLLKEMKVV